MVRKDTAGHSLESREMLISLAVCILNATLPALQSFVLVRTAGAGDIASYLLVSGWTTFAATIAVCGFEMLPVKLIPKLRADGMETTIRTFVGFSALFVLATTVVVMALFLALLCSGLLPIPRESSYVIGTWLLLPTTLLAVVSGSLRGAGAPLTGNVLNTAAPHLLFVILLLIEAGLNVKPDAATLLITAVASTVICLAAGSAGLKRVFALSAGPSAGSVGEKEERKEWLRHGVSLAIFSIVFSLHNNLGVLALGLFGKAQEVPIFVNYSRLAALASLGLASVNVLLAPLIARLSHTGETAALQAALRHSCSRGVGIWCVVVAAIATFRIDTWFAVPGGSSQGLVLVLLLAAQFAYVATGTCGLLMTMSNNQGPATKINLAAVALNLVLAAVLVPRYGAVGAAVASLAAIVYSNVHLAWAGARCVGVDPSVLSFISRRDECLAVGKAD